MILILVALLSILIILLPEIKTTDILIMIGLILFISFIALITHPVSKLEEQINKIEEKFIREKDLNKIRKEIEVLKTILLKKK